MNDLNKLILEQYHKSGLEKQMTFWRFARVFKHISCIDTIAKPNQSEMADIFDHGDRIMDLMSSAL
ncbi:hypothetical protein P8629_02695 [Hydrogenovibrio sp. 3SP14C1]|uniref:hypothetical protein n=1 Tax=Hydrogenovibrio sp. 3SP14C1 TaxID=3038774 RepID=UPI0024166583|nr:hypothetical protein [Hydrogenovibrio sp. 3SP14C1]MDG4811905.1 hypothetical protein [Hydrogenovibrio sp. 3SP14C1]